MATNITLKKITNADGTAEDLHPTTDWSQIESKPSTFAPTGHPHGNITNGGAITAYQTIASGDHLVIADNSASNALTTSSITFGTSTTQFLRNNGTWGTVSGTDSSKLPLTGGTLTGDLTMQKDGTTSNIGSHGIVFQANSALQGSNEAGDFTTELNMDYLGNLKFGGNTIFHAGNDGSASGLHADLLDGQQGSYYLNYNNLSNTPTIPTNNNQLTNGAGYISSFDITTQTDSKYLRSNANDTTTGNLTISKSDPTLILSDTNTATGNYPKIQFDTNNNQGIELYHTEFDSELPVGGYGLVVGPSDNNTQFPTTGTLSLAVLGNIYAGNTSLGSTSRVLTTADEGSGNGIDADTLDGSHASAFAAASHTHSQYAPLASPALTGTPTAPTPTAGDNDTSIATTAFVSTAISNLVNGASASFDTLKEIQDAMATDTELSNAIAGLTIGNGTQTISVGTGLDGGGSFTANQTGNSTVSISLDLSEFTDMTADVNGLADELILLDAGAERRKLISEIKLSQFNNDSGWTSNSGDITGVTAGSGLTGGSTSGNATLNVGAGTGISVAADTVGIANAYSPNTAIELTSSQNLNDITTAGFYYQTANADTSGNNYPSGEAGSLLVQKSAGLVTQTYTTYSGSPKVYVRTYYTSWGSWQRVFLDNYHPNADKWTTARTITLGGDLTGNVSFDGSANVTLTAAVSDDSHNHTIANVDGLQTALNGKASTSHTHNNYVATSGDLMTGDLTLDHDGETTTNDSHGIVFTARAVSTDFERKLYMDDGANLLFGTDTIFHSGNDGSASGLHADLLDGQQGSYYLNYNNLSNTPTIPTNNNQLTNGAGYVTGSHSHSTSNITSGNFNTARLGTGTATSGYVLKSDGDGTASWQQDNNTTYSLGSFGVTATASELNKMDGVTATTTELNYTDGVTSNIQTQLNSKLSTSAAAAAVSYVTSCPTSTNSTGMKVYVGSTDCSTKYSGWLYIVT